MFRINQDVASLNDEKLHRIKKRYTFHPGLYLLSLPFPLTLMLNSPIRCEPVNIGCCRGILGSSSFTNL
jgi:hypothetical protein